MANVMTTKGASACQGISERRINTLCAEGRLPRAYKEGNPWFIPQEVQKPTDKRRKQGGVLVKTLIKKLPLPNGISDYRKTSSEYYYVDKTLMIRDFIDERPQVPLITRPRCFGKTLNMDMLRVHFEKTNEDTGVYFRNKKIWNYGAEYQGKYPVTYATFKDIKCKTWEATYDMIFKIL